jgi:hypothetical protein
LRDAVVMAQQYNANRSKGRPAMQPHDFMPVEKRAQTQHEMLRILQSAKR